VLAALSIRRESFLIGQNAGGMTLILQASSPAVSDTLFDSSQAQRLQNQSVYEQLPENLSRKGFLPIRGQARDMTWDDCIFIVL
jgi:hypothetical protein